MDMFIAQLSQLLTSTDEDSWLAGLCDLLRSHINARVCLAGHDGKIIIEALPNELINTPDTNAFTMEKPIIAGASLLGHLTLTRLGSVFTEAEKQMLDFALCIYTVLLHQQEKQAQSQRRQQAQAVREAINALSFSELEAAIHISQAITGLEGRMVAGHVADKLGFTRSIVVTALKKLEGAGIIETRSLGVKGTYIRIREPLLVEELGKLTTGRGLTH